MSSVAAPANTPCAVPCPSTPTSPLCTAPPGTQASREQAELHPVDALDGAAVAALATELGAELVIVGPEAPLVAGVADAVRAAGIPCFGPSEEAAQLEGSKAFAKDVMAGAGVPHGTFVRLHDARGGRRGARRLRRPRTS